MPLNKPLILVVGPSGSGKSSSIENLDPATTRVIDIERKGFPFLVTEQWSNSIVQVDTPQLMLQEIKKALKDPTVKVLIIESFLKYAEVLLTQSKAICKGYDIYNNYNTEIRTIIDSCKNDKVIVVWTAIDEIVKIPQANGTETAVKRVKVAGKEHEGSIEKEFLIVLFTEPKMNPTTKKMEYRFITNSDGINSAKTPKYLEFEPAIPNDLSVVIKQLEVKSI